MLRGLVAIFAVLTLSVALRADPAGPDHSPSEAPGSLVIPATPEAPDRVVLKTGEVLRGKVVQQDEKSVVLQHPVLGKVVIPAASIKSVEMGSTHAKGEKGGKGAATKPAATTAPYAPAGLVVEPELAGTGAPIVVGPITKPWKSSITLAVSDTEDTNETLGGSVEVKSQKTTLDEKLTFDAGFYYTEVNGQVSRNEATAGVAKDWLIRDSPWFWFGQGRFDYAEFRPYRERLSGATGPGYQLIKDKTWDVSLRLGAGGYQEWGDSDNSFHPEGSLGTQASWNISKTQKLSATETFYADLGIIGRSRNIASADWQIKLDQFSGLSLKFSVQDEYDSFVASNTGDISHNDARLLGGMQLDF